MRTRIFILLAIFAFLIPSVVLAHPGHGTFDGHTYWHYLTSPVHLISTMVIIAVTVFGIRYFRKKSRELN